MYWAENDRRIHRYLSSSVNFLWHRKHFIFVILSVFVDRHDSGHLSRPCQIIWSSSFHSSFFWGEVANVRLWWLESTPFRLAVESVQVLSSFPGFPSKRHKKTRVADGSMGQETWRKMDTQNFKNRRCFQSVASFLVEVSGGTGQFTKFCFLISTGDGSTPGESTETSWTWPAVRKPSPRRSHAKKNCQKWDWWMFPGKGLFWDCPCRWWRYYQDDETHDSWWNFLVWEFRGFDVWVCNMISKVQVKVKCTVDSASWMAWRVMCPFLQMAETDGVSCRHTACVLGISASWSLKPFATLVGIEFWWSLLTFGQCLLCKYIYSLCPMLRYVEYIF